MTIAIPLKKQGDYTELRYALRSIERHVGGDVIIIGEGLPEWCTNVTWIKLKDVEGRKQLSMRYKILSALEYSKNILLTHDDVFLLQKSDFPYYWSGSLGSYGESGARPLKKQLEAMGRTFRNYDLHYPLLYDQRFKEASEKFSSEVILKSMYCNYWGIEGIEFPDNKLLKQKTTNEVIEFIKGKPSFSTGAYSLKIALPVLQELYPKKSKYEIE